MEKLLDNFRDFIARVGFRILQVPDTPQEYVGAVPAVCLLRPVCAAGARGYVSGSANGTRPGRLGDFPRWPEAYR